MTICDFMIIGAMKAGTTSLYNDLYPHPALFLPDQKEPEVLLRAESDTQIKARFDRLMKPAPAGTLKGEASTGYTKRPMSEGCAARALRILGPDVKLIYIERDPIDRAISHYRHCALEGTESDDIDDALLNNPQYIDYGRYEWQIAPWVDSFGKDQILVLSFDDYRENRDDVLGRVAEFLGVSAEPIVGQPVEIHNSSDGKLVAAGWRAKFIGSDLFQNTLKPLFPRKLRRMIMPFILKPAQPTQKEIRQETADILKQRLAEKR